jgi:hypothetical protein
MDRSRARIGDWFTEVFADPSTPRGRGGRRIGPGVECEVEIGERATRASVLRKEHE